MNNLNKGMSLRVQRIEARQSHQNNTKTPRHCERNAMKRDNLMKEPSLRS